MSAPALSGRERQGRDYLAAVEHELGDVEADDRAALLEDLAQHLDALAAEEADDRTIAERLGPPAAYAADLRAAAGLPPRAADAAATGLRDRLDRLRASSACRRVRPVAREAGRLVRELRPAWWVVRGYLLVLVPCLLDPDHVRDFPVPAPLGSHLVGGLLVLAAVAGSVALGRRRLPLPAAAVVAAGGVSLVVLALLAGANTWNGVVQDYSYAPPAQQPADYPLLSRYGPVTDIFPYAADGTPLDGVLLYDQDGRPLHVGLQEWWADGCARVLDQPRADDGVAVPYSYPQVYVLDPAGVDISRSIPRPPDSCAEVLERPQVPLPTFAADDAAEPTAPTESSEPGA